MGTDENAGMNQRKEELQKKRSKICLAVILLLITLISAMAIVPAYGTRSEVKKIIESFENKDLNDMAKKEHYRTLPVLEELGDYIADLGARKNEENEAIEKSVKDIETRVDLLEQNLAAIQNKDETDSSPICCLFTGELDGNKGEVYTEGLEDTITYMNCASGSREGDEWDQYDRLEVDMFKRSGKWDRTDSQWISATLPDTIEKGTYRVCIFLRTDVSRESGRGWTEQQLGAVNGGSVTLSVGDQMVYSGLMQQTSMGERRGEDKILYIHGGEKIQLSIDPEDGASFFSFAVCVNRETSDWGGGTDRD